MTKGQENQVPRAGDGQSALSTEEVQELRQYEQVIARGLGTFYEVGVALATIRTKRLYRQTHKTFESYCKDCCGLVSSRARQLIGAAEVVDSLKSVTTVTPVNEAQVRPLVRLVKDARVTVWAEAVNRSDGKCPTALMVREAITRAYPALAVRDNRRWPGRSMPTSETRMREVLDIVRSIGNYFHARPFISSHWTAEKQARIASQAEEMAAIFQKISSGLRAKTPATIVSSRRPAEPRAKQA